ncbi:nucleotidyltransferase family protein [Enterococcus innesii]|uniref:nucleotidyltransferase family protein n=1 Tax=Enterococcus innesii TaxID=2839759 RepID=UPI003B593484
MYQYEALSIQETELNKILEKDNALYKIIRNVSALGIPNLYVGGGSVTQSVWNHLFSKPIGYGISDVDIVYFDTDLSLEKERMVLEQIVKTTKQNQYALDVKNEARVHLWYEEEFGFSIPAYTSTEEAISTWPSTATSIGVFFDQENKLQIFAPYGMYDLFSGIVRPNKAMISREVYEKKIEKWCSKWPELNVIGWK